LFYCFNIFATEDCNFTVEETYVGYYPNSNYVNIIEYDILSKTKDPDEILNNIAKMSESIINSKYSQEKYMFNNFISVEETLTRKNKFIQGDYQLVTSEMDVIANITDLFSKVLETPVKVEVSENQVKMYFTCKGQEFFGNSTFKIFEKKNERMIIWPKDAELFEVAIYKKNKKSSNILKYFTNDIKSKEITEEEIEYMKNSSPKLDNNEELFQDDSDIYRLRHLKYYGYLIEQYKKKTGYYPFQGKLTIPVYVFIANKEQLKSFKDPIPTEHKVFTFKELLLELETVLNIKIDQYFDPQYVPLYKPSLYMYMVSENTYYLAVHVSKYYSFSKKVANNYYKIELSNNIEGGNKLLTFDQLLANSKYLEEISKLPVKEAFFIDREKKHINEY